MAPTIYLSELPSVRKPTIPYSRRRQRVQNGAITKQRHEQRRLDSIRIPRDTEASLTPPKSPLWKSKCTNDSLFCTSTIVGSSSLNNSARIPANVREHWKVFLARRKGLLDIVIRTMALVRRNNILQERVNALRTETRDFIHSVLNNPENKCMQQKLDSVECCETDVSSTTAMRKTVERPFLSESDSFSSDVTSTCDSNDSEEQSSDDES